MIGCRWAPRELPARYAAVPAVWCAVLVLLLLPAGASAAEIHRFGAGDQRVEVALHDGLISIYAAKVPADVVLDDLRELGGPTYSSIEPLTRPVTVTMHRATMEAVLRKMLVGYNYALHYRNGRVVHVRVLMPVPGMGYKVPPPVETRSHWLEVETGDGEGG